MEHDPTLGTGPSTTGNEHNQAEIADAPSRSQDAAEERERTTSPKRSAPNAHRVVPRATTRNLVPQTEPTARGPAARKLT